MHYVNAISEYGKLQLKEYNSPVKKDSYLVGRSFYNENGYLFDDNPGFYKQTMPVTLTIVEVPHYIHSQEIKDLWQGEFGDMKSVKYDGQIDSDDQFQKFSIILISAP